MDHKVKELKSKKTARKSPAAAGGSSTSGQPPANGEGPEYILLREVMGILKTVAESIKSLAENVKTVNENVLTVNQNIVATNENVKAWNESVQDDLKGIHALVSELEVSGNRLTRLEGVIEMLEFHTVKAELQGKT